MSEEHFSVDGTLIESLASLKSVRPKGDDRGGPIDPDNQGVDFHGERRSNDTHASVTDPEAKLFRKSRAAATKLFLISPPAMRSPRTAADSLSTSPSMTF